MDLNYNQIVWQEYGELFQWKDANKLTLCKQHMNEIIPYLQFVLNYFKDKKDINFVEIGTCKGGNFVLCGNVLTVANKNVSGIAIDLPNQDKWGGYPVNPADEIKKFNPKFKYEVIIGNSHHPGTVTQFKSLLKDKKLDLLFIDGDHSYVGCKKDFELYTPFVNKGGLIVLHDVKNYPHWKHVEVWKFWREMSKKYKFHEFSYNVNYGIGVLEV